MGTGRGFCGGAEEVAGEEGKQDLDGYSRFGFRAPTTRLRFGFAPGETWCRDKNTRRGYAGEALASGSSVTLK